MTFPSVIVSAVSVTFSVNDVTTAVVLSVVCGESVTLTVNSKTVASVISTVVSNDSAVDDDGVSLDDGVDDKNVVDVDSSVDDNSVVENVVGIDDDGSGVIDDAAAVVSGFGGTVDTNTQSSNGVIGDIISENIRYVNYLEIARENYFSWIEFHERTSC